MFCKNCGKELSDTAKFCSGCGTQQVQENLTVTTNNDYVVEEEQNANPSQSFLTPVEDPEVIEEVLTEINRHYKPPFWDRIRTGFMIFRCICCFTTILSILGPALVLYLDSVGKLTGFWDKALFVVMLIGFASTIFACPLRLLAICGGIITTCFTIGLYFFGIGALVGGAIGVGVSIMLILFGSCFISIPYFFTDLRYEV